MTDYNDTRYIREAHIRSDVGILPMSRTTFRKLIAEGKLPKPSVLIGKINYWLRKDVLDAVDRMAEQQRRTPPTHGNLKHQPTHASQ